MKKVKTLLYILMVGFLFSFSKKGYCQNANSLNQHDKRKNAVGTDNKNQHPHKSKQKMSRSKNGNLTNQSSADDNLPVDSVDVVPTIIHGNKKPH